ncbi:MarR family winged helix-turn-helix transcriptional regulator [Micromonospora andamanensis]|uniref:MarR family transcriptional regulator n=1 Tax=Micromonospora andamanensis TaxID=1287068 RepID=A0ABQ4I218_9ACTN|nr:MarR family winged helix-turn-helix transcriptional regulator [Micromonospora andamanensis]GIJ11968.1 MarR family transcriptional regulator [Micromonospora andamanensis]GIJ42559.1 MarR family transcriptional regulator [Micromonospora andamanensis]
MQEEPWQLAWTTYRALRLTLDAKVAHDLEAETGLSMADFEVLAETDGVLRDPAEHCVRVNALAVRMRWSTSRLSRQLGRMQQRGLITREACELDGRGDDVVLTKAGRRAIDKAMQVHAALVRTRFADLLSDDQVATFANLCGLLLDRSAASGDARHRTARKGVAPGQRSSP